MTPNARIRDLQSRLEAYPNAGVLCIGPTRNMHYLLGFTPHADERVHLLCVTQGTVAAVVPTMSRELFERAGIETYHWNDTEGPRSALEKVLARVNVRKGDGVSVGIDDSVRADWLLHLQAVLDGNRTYYPASRVVGAMRLRKSAEELEILRKAARMADQAVAAGFAAAKPGMTEKQLAAVIERSFLENGAESIAFCIVGGGPGSATPHHETGDRPIAAGEPLLIDTGCLYKNYYSDITRMAFLGEPTEWYRKVHATVLAAVRAAEAKVRPGVTCGEIDAAARTVIAEAGFGEYFIHRTGHGLGLDGHEPPWIMQENPFVLEAGMVFSIEPGIYLPREFGVRIEDIVVVTENGCENLSGYPRELATIPLSPAGRGPT